MLVRLDLGDPLMENRLSKTMTTEEDTVTFTVPDHERWIVDVAWMRNATLSAGDLVAKIYAADPSGNLIYLLAIDWVLGSVEDLQYPNTSATQEQLSANPIPVYGGQKIVFSWGADACKSGTGYYYLGVRQFKEKVHGAYD